MSIIAVRCRTHNRGERPLAFRVLQYAIDRDNRRVRRELTAQNDTIVKGPWEHVARPFEPGLYCVHCLNEGKREPLPIDELDLRDLGLLDPPLVFQTPNSVSADAAVDSLRTRFGDRVCAVQELPAREVAYADDSLVRRLHPGLRRAITQQLLPDGGRFYAFQSTAIDAALNGHDVAVTTPTASGKSLTYTIPVIDTLLRDPNATALYLSPLVALTEDQLEAVSRIDLSGTDWVKKGERFSIHRVCRTLDTGFGSVTVARYDGAVTTGDRQSIRETRPQYLLTTPDMLHIAILSGAFNDRQWRYLFQGLRYVVVDELHTYRGIMGAAFANLLRRLQRICRMYGANPQFLCASATMVEPARTVEQFIGRTPVVVDGSEIGAPQRKRQFVLWDGGISDSTATALTTHAKNVLLHLLGDRIRTIAFARSISEINDIYRFVTAELRESGLAEPIIKPFMRELLPNDKRAIIQELKSGRLHGVIATTALSMGIDIGSLSAAVIIGFPGSIAQLWQQAGRAGRAGEGVIVLIADRNPLDQFFVHHPEVLFDLRAEPVYLNPDNPYIVRSHLLRAAEEAPLGTGELAQFGHTAQTLVQELIGEGLMAADSAGRVVLTDAGSERASEPFRNMTFAVPVLTEERQQVVEVDAARAQRALHKYAHYQHIDRYYRVTRCDLDWEQGRGEVLVQELEHAEYTTTAKVDQEVTILATLSEGHAGAFQSGYGRVQCRTAVVGYYKIPLFTRTEAFQFQPLGMAAPDPLAYTTQAFWFTLDRHLFDSILPAEQNAGLYSLAGAIRLATAIEELCDPSDIDALGYVSHPDSGLPMVLLYDTVPGGVGIAEAAFRILERVLQRAEQILADCPYCSVHPESRGCPYCVTAQYGDESTINRAVALELLRALHASV